MKEKRYILFCKSTKKYVDIDGEEIEPDELMEYSINSYGYEDIDDIDESLPDILKDSTGLSDLEVHEIEINIDTKKKYGLALKIKEID